MPSAGGETPGTAQEFLKPPLSKPPGGQWGSPSLQVEMKAMRLQEPPPCAGQLRLGFFPDLSPELANVAILW